jgi:hypothetical protein
MADKKKKGKPYKNFSQSVEIVWETLKDNNTKVILWKKL